MRLLTRQGYLVEEEGMTYLAEADPESALVPLQAAACTYRIALGPRAGQKVLSFQTVPTQAVQPTPQRCVNEHGFSLHAEVCCTAQQRKKLEHLCRYITRPAIANERLTLNRAGQVVLTLKTPYRDGTTHIVMSPLEFMQRLAALVPRPRLHLIRFHGVLAPHAKLRPQITPDAPLNANNASKGHSDAPQPSAPNRLSWAQLLKRVFEIDIQQCPHCGGSLRIIAAIVDPRHC
jgi:Putative transposase